MGIAIQRNASGLYSTHRPVTSDEIIGFAKDLVAERFHRSHVLNSPDDARQYLLLELAREEREVFGVIFVDRQNQVIAFERMFYGTVDSSTVHPREIVKRCLHHNATAVLLAHNHPSGVAEPSKMDIQLTQALLNALALVDATILDHFVVGGSTVTSFAERGLL